MHTVIRLPAGTAYMEPHRYQVYRQHKSGFHYNYGPIIDTPEEAVTAFLRTSPAFDGGGVRLWDHYHQSHVASAEWPIEATRMGFTVRHRINHFHHPALAVIAAEIPQRERIEQSVTERLQHAI